MAMARVLVLSRVVRALLRVRWIVIILCPLLDRLSLCCRTSLFVSAFSLRLDPVMNVPLLAYKGARVQALKLVPLYLKSSHLKGKTFSLVNHPESLTFFLRPLNIMSVIHFIQHTVDQGEKTTSQTSIAFISCWYCNDARQKFRTGFRLPESSAEAA
jgi:hypothetical protein